MLKQSLAIAAATMLVLSPIAAEANTRAAAASVSLDMAPSQIIEDDDDDDEFPIWAILLGVLILGGVAAAIGGDVSENNEGFPGNNASPGTGG